MRDYYDGLVRRLRDQPEPGSPASGVECGECGTITDEQGGCACSPSVVWGPRDALKMEAADAIEKLQAERDKQQRDLNELAVLFKQWSEENQQLQVELAEANADAERLAAALNPCWTQKECEALAAHRARVGEKPLRCDNCGKTMAEHGPLANCHARVGDDQ